MFHVKRGGNPLGERWRKVKSLYPLLRGFQTVSGPVIGACSLLAQAAPKPEKKVSPTVNYVAEAERELSGKLGRACHIAHGRKKGRIEIEYYGVDDLNDLLEALHTIKKK